MNSEQLKQVMKDPAKREEMLKKLFDGLDKEKKGYLEPESMKKFLMGRGAALGFPAIEPPKEDEERILKAADPTHSGKVDFNGFKAAHLLIMKESKEMVENPAKREAELRKIFNLLDHDKKGYLSIAIMEGLEKKVDQFEVPIMFKLSEKEKNEMKKIGDPNSTGKLTFEGCKAIADAIAAKIKQDGLF